MLEIKDRDQATDVLHELDTEFGTPWVNLGNNDPRLIALRKFYAPQHKVPKRVYRADFNPIDDSEDAFITEARLHGKTYREIADYLHTSVDRVGERARILGVNGRGSYKFSPKQDKFIQENYLGMAYKDIAKELGTTVQKVNTRIQYLRENGKLGLF